MRQYSVAILIEQANIVASEHYYAATALTEHAKAEAQRAAKKFEERFGSDWRQHYTLDYDSWLKDSGARGLAKA